MTPDRFWSKVDKHGPHAGRLGRCWVWIGAYYPGGYGKTYRGRKAVLAHRVAWGDVPTGLCVLHHCDNPPCVRRSHLFRGTRADNSADMVAKGRQGGMGQANGSKTHCPSGHLYDQMNTYIWTRHDGYQIRFCRTCHRRKKAA